jgi:hypothetical protein
MDNVTLRTLLLAASFLVPLAPAHAEGLLAPSAEATAPVVDTGQPQAAAAVEAAKHLVPFAEPNTQFQLTGESDTTELTFTLNARQVAAGGNLVLAYQNAVSILPDNGKMTVEVNGKSSGEFQIASPFDYSRQVIALNPADLREGTNVVRISAAQFHRVDCALDATYELWTRISPDRSGFESPLPATASTFADLLSAGRMEDGATEVRVVLPPKANDEMLNSASAIVQALVLYLGRQDVVVTVADRPGDGPGIDLFAGIGAADPAAAGGLRLYAEAPYGVTIKPSTDPARMAVIFRAESREDLENQLLEAIRGPMAAGFKDHRKAKRFGVVAARAEQTFTLGETGFRSTTFGGRLLRTHFDMVMPADFYPGDYSTLDMTLSAATAPGLDPGSQMLVRVNDKVVNSFPFRNTDGQTFKGKLIELPLRAFHPGVNKIELIAELPKAADKSCAAAARDDGKPRYVLLEETTFSVPPLARVTRQPDLSAFSGNAYPYGSGRPFDIYLGTPDTHSTSAAMTVLARLAMASGAPLKGSFKFALPAPDAKGDALVVTTETAQASLKKGPRNASPLMAGYFRVDDDAAQLMTADRISTAAIFDGTPDNGGSDQLIRAFEDSTADNGAELSWVARLKSLVGSATGRFGNWLSYEDAKPIQIDAADMLLSVVQTASNDTGGTLTEIRAASSEDLARGIRRLAEPGIWNSLTGGAALIESKSMDLVTLQGQQQAFAEITDQSVGNYRRIAAAWLSDNFQAYVAMVIVLVGLFSAWLGKMVQRRGVRTDI